MSYLRAVHPTDEPFLYEVFCTTWQNEVAALPNQNLARHVLRIQHIAQERRFTSRFPGHQRFVIMEDGERAGRLYILRTSTFMHIVDLTLMPEYQGHGLDSRVVRDLMAHAAVEFQPIAVRVSRTDAAATDHYASLGFDLVDVDDLDNFFEWRPPPVAVPVHGSRTVPDDLSSGLPVSPRGQG